MSPSLIETRRQYAELIRRNAGMRSERLVEAFAEMPREAFLGPGPWQVLRPPNLLTYETTPSDDPACIYDDVLVALDPSRKLNNGLPSGLARWIDALDLREGESVLHAGCGTGYYTAVIAHVVGSSGRVIALEVDRDLAAAAKFNLRQFPWVEVIAASAATYNPGSLDAILINAGATHPLALWLDSLAPSGRLIFPLIRWPEGAQFGSGPAGFGVMLRVQRLKHGWSARFISMIGVYPCLGALDPDADRLLARAFERGVMTDVASLRRDPHAEDTSCLLHGNSYCFSKTTE